MPTPYTLLAELEIGEPSGSPNQVVSVPGVSTYTAKSDQRLSFSGAGTDTVSLGTLPAGAKALLVQYLTDGAPVDTVLIRVNGEVAGGFSLSPGGFMFCALTNITALAFVRTAACVIRVVALG